MMRRLIVALVAMVMFGLLSDGAAAQGREPGKTPFATPSAAKTANPAAAEQTFFQRMWAPVVAAQDELHRALANAVSMAGTTRDGSIGLTR